VNIAGQSRILPASTVTLPAELWTLSGSVQLFCRESELERGAPCEASEMVHFRHRIEPDGADPTSLNQDLRTQGPRQTKGWLWWTCRPRKRQLRSRSKRSSTRRSFDWASHLIAVPLDFANRPQLTPQAPVRRPGRRCCRLGAQPGWAPGDLCASSGRCRAVLRRCAAAGCVRRRGP